MSNDQENIDLSIEEDNTYVGPSSIIERQEDTVIVEEINNRELINKKIDTAIDNFSEGKSEEFKNMVKFLFNRVMELEHELGEIRKNFYRNELTDDEFDEILLELDNEDANNT